MKYEHVFSKLPPKVLLHDYWEVLNFIKWQIPTPEFTMDEILKIISDNPYYYGGVRAQKIVDETIDYLIRAGLIKQKNEHFIRKKEYSDFFYFLKKNIKDSATRRVAWAVWYLHSKGVEKFIIEQVLDILSYSDVEYREELKNLQPLNEIYHISKPILIQDLRERIFTAISKLSSKNVSEDKIIQKIRELEMESTERVLKKLKLSFEDKMWKINDETLSKIREELKGKQSVNWPFFGDIIVSGQPYFKMLRGNSCKAYVDIPNQITVSLIKELTVISGECENLQEFYSKAYRVIDSYNDMLKKDGKEYFKHELDWIYFSLYSSPFTMKKYGVKVNINWNKFKKFIEEFSKATNIKIWRKYEYITLCRYLSLDLVLKRNLESTQNSVKEISMEDISEIKNQLDDLNRYLESVKVRIMKILRRKRWKEYLEHSLIHSGVLLFIPEMMSTIEILKDLVEKGAITSSYREIRKIMEGLTWVVFDDVLLLRGIKHIPNDIIHLPPYRYVSKEWYESVRGQRDLIVRNISDLKNKIKNIVNALDSGHNRKVMEDAIFKNLSYASFLLLLGIDSSKIKDNNKRFIPAVYDTATLLPIAKEDLKNALETVGISRDEFESKIADIFSTLPQMIIPPYPSNDFILSFVDKTFSTKLRKKYSEYSFFIHSYIASWHIFPFSSVLEFKILKYELSTFNQLIKEILEGYLNLYEA